MVMYARNTTEHMVRLKVGYSDLIFIRDTFSSKDVLSNTSLMILHETDLAVVRRGEC